jgi:hypothetical protein
MPPGADVVIAPALAALADPGDFLDRFGAGPDPSAAGGFLRRWAGFLAGVDPGVEAPPAPPPGVAEAKALGSGTWINEGRANVGGGGAVRMATKKSRISS